MNVFVFQPTLDEWRWMIGRTLVGFWIIRNGRIWSTQREWMNGQRPASMIIMHLQSQKYWFAPPSAFVLNSASTVQMRIYYLYRWDCNIYSVAFRRLEHILAVNLRSHVFVPNQFWVCALRISNNAQLRMFSERRWRSHTFNVNETEKSQLIYYDTKVTMSIEAVLWVESKFLMPFDTSNCQSTENNGYRLNVFAFIRTLAMLNGICTLYGWQQYTYVVQQRVFFQKLFAMFPETALTNHIAYVRRKQKNKNIILAKTSDECQPTLDWADASSLLLAILKSAFSIPGEWILHRVFLIWIQRWYIALNLTNTFKIDNRIPMENTSFSILKDIRTLSLFSQHDDFAVQMTRTHHVLITLFSNAFVHWVDIYRQIRATKFTSRRIIIIEISMNYPPNCPLIKTQCFPEASSQSNKSKFLVHIFG